MKIAIFGLSISSAWGNGHATLLRGLFRALHAEGHEIHFFERNVPYYASHRDADAFPYAQLHLYADWNQTLPLARQTITGADAAIVTSYCADGAAASDLVLSSTVPRKVFYDMDTPVTLQKLQQGESVPYLPPAGLGGFDLVLSYTGGNAVTTLRDKLRARRVATLYGWVDSSIYRRTGASPHFACDLSYLGTYSADRQAGLQELLLTPAEQLRNRGFVIGGAMYPNTKNWPPNVKFYEHVVPADHPAFYSSSPLTLNVTRASMAALGYCPSGRLFEAAACGTAVLSDWWEGMDAFFEPGEEILIANTTEDTIRALSAGQDVLSRIASRARQRTLDCHTAGIRARRLIQLLEEPQDERHLPRVALGNKHADAFQIDGA